jgi:hypothetical protein
MRTSLSRVRIESRAGAHSRHHDSIASICDPTFEEFRLPATMIVFAIQPDAYPDPASPNRNSRPRESALRDVASASVTNDGSGSATQIRHEPP